MKILVLSGGKDFDLGRSHDVTTESQIGNIDGYQTTPKALQKITELTKGKKVDLVIIQNNMGIGIEKAKAVDSGMIDKVIICWNSKPSSSDTAPYERLGIKHFIRFDELDKLLEGIA